MSTTRGYRTRRSKPNGERSVDTVPSAPGVATGNSSSSQDRNAAVPARRAAAGSGRREHDGSKAEKYVRAADAATAASNR